MDKGVTRVLVRSEVERLLDLERCIAGVENAFRFRGAGGSTSSGVLGLAADRGGVHVKAALTTEGRPLFTVKLNANFPDNPRDHGLPTIQGVVALIDGVTGRPLALMDSIALTIRRTAAATAVAAKFLARPDASTVTIVGCGAQASAQLEGLSKVRMIDRVFAHDRDREQATRFASGASTRLGVPVVVVDDLRAATRESLMIVTCTTARYPVLMADDVRPGTFVAAVGADNAEKHEIDPMLMAGGAVVTDDTAQCAQIGDLHHALAAGAMKPEAVRAELALVVVDPSKGRRHPDEVVIFDSTGIPLEDAAAAAIVYQGAHAEGIGLAIDLTE